MAQGIEDGYLQACEIIIRMTDLDERGITLEDIERLGATDAIIGQPFMVAEAKERYDAHLMKPLSSFLTGLRHGAKTYLICFFKQEASIKKQ